MTGRRPRGVALTAALLLAMLALTVAGPSHASGSASSVNVGWVRVARVLWRQVQPWILTLGEILLDQLPGGTTGSPPPPEPIEPPPVPDPEYTP